MIITIIELEINIIQTVDQKKDLTTYMPSATKIITQFL